MSVKGAGVLSGAPTFKRLGTSVLVSLNILNHIECVVIYLNIFLFFRFFLVFPLASFSQLFYFYRIFSFLLLLLLNVLDVWALLYCSV